MRNYIYLCDKCAFIASSSGHLKFHKENIHEGIPYPCDKCEFAASSTSHLKFHKESNMKEYDIRVLSVITQTQRHVTLNVIKKVDME